MTAAAAPTSARVPELVYIQEVLARTGVNRDTVSRWVARGVFPRPIDRPPGGRRMWRRAEVERWLRGEGAGDDD